MYTVVVAFLTPSTEAALAVFFMSEMIWSSMVASWLEEVVDAASGADGAGGEMLETAAMLLSSVRVSSAVSLPAPPDTRAPGEAGDHGGDTRHAGQAVHLRAVQGHEQVQAQWQGEELG